MPLACDLEDAGRYLPRASPEELQGFATRQLRARHRATLLLGFYGKYSCRLSNLHLLGTCAVTLGRFAGASREFDEMGAEFMCVQDEGTPRTSAWKDYADACAARRPLEVRDELWLAAHMQDMQRARQMGLEEEFYRQAALHADDPVWVLSNEHMQATLGTRLTDHLALSGSEAYETAFAHSLTATFFRLCTRSWKLVRRYGWEGLRAALCPAREPDRGLVSNRELALRAIRYSAIAWRASRVYSRGMRARDRGSHEEQEGWPSLAEILGEQTADVHPLILQFYQNPSRFKVKASVHFYTLPAKIWSWLATLLVGQGLYEDNLDDIDARFRVFRRRDGSMHFLRELYCGENLRVFDSDFIVRSVNGTRALFEVFVDKHIEVQMSVHPLAGGGLSIEGEHIYYRGMRLPGTGLNVRFQTQVKADDRGMALHIDGQLLMKPRSGWGKLLMCRLLRRPELLGGIHYVARPTTAESFKTAFS
jgi:hypothetical protein